MMVFIAGIYALIMITIEKVVVIKPFLIYGETPEMDNAKEDY